MTRPLRTPPRGQQRDKLWREALRLELAAAGEDLKELREIARVVIARCKAGDMQAVKELGDRLDGKPTQLLEHAGESERPRVVFERRIVHVTKTREEFEKANGQIVDVDYEEAQNGMEAEPAKLIETQGKPPETEAPKEEMFKWPKERVGRMRSMGDRE